MLLCDQPVADNWDDWLLASGLDPAAAKNRRLIIDANVRLQAAVDGQGFVLTNLPLVEREFSKGNLVQPFDVQIEDMGYHILHREDLHLSRSARLFKTWIMSQASTFVSAEM